MKRFELKFLWRDRTKVGRSEVWFDILTFELSALDDAFGELTRHASF